MSHNDGILKESKPKQRIVVAALVVVTLVVDGTLVVATVVADVAVVVMAALL